MSIFNLILVKFTDVLLPINTVIKGRAKNIRYLLKFSLTIFTLQNMVFVTKTRRKSS